VSTATLSTKGQLVIPSRFRKALQLRPGDRVAFLLEGEKLVQRFFEKGTYFLTASVRMK
jgi:AbrB family looped-hinge helix DNA binding protein